MLILGSFRHRSTMENPAEELGVPGPYGRWLGVFPARLSWGHVSQCQALIQTELKPGVPDGPVRKGSRREGTDQQGTQPDLWLSAVGLGGGPGF